MGGLNGQRGGGGAAQGKSRFGWGIILARTVGEGGLKNDEEERRVEIERGVKGGISRNKH